MIKMSSSLIVILSYFFIHQRYQRISLLYLQKVNDLAIFKHVGEFVLQVGF